MKYVSVKNRQQLEAVLETNAADAIISPFVSDKSEPAQPCMILSLPDAARQRHIETIKGQILSAEAVIIKNIDELGLLKELDFKGKAIGGELLYAYNSEAVRFYQSFFPDMRFIAPAELTDAELAKLEKAAGISFIYKVYGAQKLMTTAQYLNGKFKDEKDECFFALFDETAGYSEVYTDRPVSMLDKPSAWDGHDILLEFTYEKPEQVKGILGTMSAQGIIRGHHYKGID